jgi:hypothetical protein
MYLMGEPNYNEGERLNLEDFRKLSDSEIINSYTIIRCRFKFQPTVKYPSIPVNVDKDTICYPLEGVGVITGAEYVVAEKQGCVIEIMDVYRIPFVTKIVRLGDYKNKSKSGEFEDVIKVDEDKGRATVVVKPFKGLIDEIQRKRREYPKTHALNVI